MAKIRAAVYTRVSTDKEEQQKSLATQEAQYTEFCEEKGYELYKVYADEGTATTVRRRPQFVSMLHDAGLDYHMNHQGTDIFNTSDRSPRFDLIIIKDTSRFSRNLEIGMATVNRLLSKGVTVLFENVGIRSDDPNASFILPLLFTMAENESTNLSKRVKFTKRYNARTGHYKPATLPYGYMRDDEGNIIIHPQESKIVKWIYDTFEKGEAGTTLIAKMINEQGIPTKFGASWSQSTVAKVIKNKVYTGTAQVQKKTKRTVTDTRPTYLPTDEWVDVPDAVDPIITMAQWMKCQEIVAKRTNPDLNKGKNPQRSNPFRGKLNCACGAPMYFTYSPKGTTYNCAARRKKGTCNVRGISTETLRSLFDSVSISSQVNTIGNNVYLKRLTNKLNKKEASLEQERFAIQKEIRELEQDTKETVKSLKTSLAGASQAVLNAMQESIEENDQRLSELNRQLSNMDAITIQNIRKAIEKKTKQIVSLKQKEHINDEEKIQFLNEIQVDNYEVRIEFSLPSYEEEVEWFNVLYPEDAISKDYPFSSLNSTLKRTHREAKVYWDFVENVAPESKPDTPVTK